MLRVAKPCADLNYGNAPLLEHHHDGLTVRGWSRAAVQSYWALPELKLLFDHGAHSWDLAAGYPRLAITHAHPDHLAGLFSYLSTRNVMRQDKTQVFVPPSIVDDVRVILDAWTRLTRDKLQVELVPCAPGDRLPVGRNVSLAPFSTAHTIASQGYIVVEQRHKLKPDFLGRPGAELAAAKKSGIEITDAQDVDLFAYTGDTTIAAFDDNPRLYDVKVLVMEATFVSEEPSADHARKFGHVHLDDIVARAHLFKNECIVLAHFSTRLSREMILERVQSALPPEFLERAVAWL